jgi:hypothetical protein
LLDQLDSFSRLEGKSVQRLAGEQHLRQTWDLDNHACNFGSEL